MINDTHPAEHNHSTKLLAFPTVFDYGAFSHHHNSEEEQYCSCGCLLPVEKTKTNEFNGNIYGLLLPVKKEHPHRSWSPSSVNKISS